MLDAAESALKQIITDCAMPDFSVGQIYFMIRYEDQKSLFMAAETMVYLGVNLLKSDPLHPFWYFQDAQSFCRDGALLPDECAAELQFVPLPEPTKDHIWKPREDQEVYALQEEDIAVMLDFDGFQHELAECRLRWQSAEDRSGSKF